MGPRGATLKVHSGGHAVLTKCTDPPQEVTSHCPQDLEPAKHAVRKLSVGKVCTGGLGEVTRTMGVRQSLLEGAGHGVSKLGSECGCGAGSSRWPSVYAEGEGGKWPRSTPLFLEKSLSELS